MNRRTCRTSQPERRPAKGEFIYPVSRKLLQPHDFDHRDTGFGDQVQVHRQVVACDVGGRLVLDCGLVAADDHRAVPLHKPLSGGDIEAGSIDEESLRVVPDSHSSGADQDNVTFLQRDPLTSHGLLQVVMPMKYSPDRSSKREASARARMRERESELIMFRRPISSLSPYGLLPTAFRGTVVIRLPSYKEAWCECISSCL